MKAKCYWCEGEFDPKWVGANEKRFCTVDCKDDFNTALRHYGRKAHDAGDVSVETLRRDKPPRKRSWRRSLGRE